MKKSLCLVALTMLSCFQLANAQTLVVNEIMARNIDMMLDPSYNYGGWIELYNPTDAAISLNGMFISNDTIPSNRTNTNSSHTAQLTSSHGSVPAKGYKTLWFDHYDAGSSGGWGGNTGSTLGKNQIKFKIRPDGDTLYIYDKNRKLIITQISPKAIARTSFARKTDGGDEWGYTATPTEGKSNANCLFCSEQLEEPQVDRPGTVYTQSFVAHVNIPEGATLRYTTDGTTPTLENGSTSEDGEFQIAKKSYVYRFRLYKDGYLPSAVVTRSYIYNDQDYYLPVVSVVTDSKNLYDDMMGVLVDGKNGIGGNGGNNNANSNKNRPWERPVNFEYLVPDTVEEYSMALNQEVDLEVSGGWSRHFPPSPSFKLKAGKLYGNKEFDYPIFTQKPYTKNKAIIVRNGGNDCDCRIVDASIHEMLSSSGFHVDCQAYQPTHVFINGEYKYMFNLRETNNKNFAYANYGIDTDEVDQFEYAGGGYAQKEGDDVAFVEWTTLCNDLSSNPNDEDIWRQICERCDIDEICNYFAAEIYIGSQDWISNNNNIKGFRDRNGGKFHIILMDVDEGFKRTDLFNQFNANKTGNNQGGNDPWGGGWGGGGSWFDNKSMKDLLSNLLTKPSFRRQFIDTYTVVAGSIFESTRVTKIMNRMARVTQAALDLEGKSPWTAQGRHNGSNLDISGRDLLNDITNKSKRAERIRVMQNFFSLDNPYDVTIQTNLDKAELMLNDVKIPTGKLEGSVFAPATLRAIAPSGYAFKGWIVDGSAAVTTTEIIKDADAWQYYDQGSLDGQNWQSPDYNATGWKSGAAPLGYNNQNSVTTKLNYGSDTNNKRPTYYFRRQFNLTKAPDAKQTFNFSYSVDDGCIIYINGTEVHRANMPEGDVTYDVFSNSVEGQMATGSFSIDPALLNQGSNVITVEVHNNNAPSSDIYWSGNLILNEQAGDGGLINEGNPELNLDGIASTASHTTITAQFEPIADEQIIENREQVAYAPIRVNEISAGNDIYVNEHYKKNDWFELYNATDMTIDVAGLYVSDNPKKPQKYQIPTGNPDVKTTIKPGGKLIIWADKLETGSSVFTYQPLGVAREGIYFANIHSGFKLSNDEGKAQEVMITSSEEFIANNPEFCEAHPSFKYFADHLVYPAHKHDQTVGRYPDGGNDLYIMNRPTIAQTNSLHSCDTFIGVDDGVIIKTPDAIDAILAENSTVSVRFAGTELQIEGTTATVQLDIYSAAGQHQLSQTVSLTAGNASVTVSNLPAGIYVASVKGTSSKAASCKFMIR
ncbi:MAG: CotH kinase family protein [Bacteroidaceae bacterium]|nr:CotH kinase family protein [Bacteroidaceae bacterium]